MLLRRYTLSQYLDYCLFLEERTLGNAADDVLRIREQSDNKLHKAMCVLTILIAFACSSVGLSVCVRAAPMLLQAQESSDV